MAKGYLIPAIMLLLCLQAKAQAPVTVVDSKNTRYQMQREVVTRWNRFNPKWYFVLFHNKYRKGEDRRNMLQLAPTMATLWANRDMAEKQEESIGAVYRQEMFKGADRSLNKGYHLLYKNKIDELNGQLSLLHLEAVKAGVKADMLLKLMEHRERINTDIELTIDSYEDDAAKGESFRGYLKDLTELRGYYRRIITLFNTTNKLTE
ncbi:hypothetical protein [Pontibacter rugosus]|uniref:Uncharacterized protein n=1 Tax=Pontibacter rugosus TaxID=1745966 RepID=A0ABW3STH6_9BACT